jgi:hypothetical protein
MVELQANTVGILKIDVDEQSANGCDRLFGLGCWMWATWMDVSMSDKWTRQHYLSPGRPSLKSSLFLFTSHCSLICVRFSGSCCGGG